MLIASIGHLTVLLEHMMYNIKVACSCSPWLCRCQRGLELELPTIQCSGIVKVRMYVRVHVCVCVVCVCACVRVCVCMCEYMHVTIWLTLQNIH